MTSPERTLLQKVRRLARELHVGLADSLAAFVNARQQSQPLAGLMTQVNHPNRAGHDLVAAELLYWFPSSPDSP